MNRFTVIQSILLILARVTRNPSLHRWWSPPVQHQSMRMKQPHNWSLPFSPEQVLLSIEDVQYKLKNEIKLNSSLSHNKIFEHINECQFKRPEKRPRKESFVLCFLMNVINLIIKRVSTWVPSSSMTINK